MIALVTPRDTNKGWVKSSWKKKMLKKERKHEDKNILELTKQDMFEKIVWINLCMRTVYVAFNTLSTTIIIKFVINLNKTYHKIMMIDLPSDKSKIKNLFNYT